MSLRLRWRLFSQLARLTDATPQAREAPSALPGSPHPALWVFVSTIGELHATQPFLDALFKQHASLDVVLLTDRTVYDQAYRAAVPGATIVHVNGRQDQAAAVARNHPPRLFVITEIPCFPSDAPCRLPFGFVYEAKRHGARLALVNGWLYGYATSCRIDAIERRLFKRQWLRLLDVACVQNTEVAAALRTAGAPNIAITGNIKFDALETQPRPHAQSRSPLMLDDLLASGRPIVVAGCVTESDERDLVLQAFCTLIGMTPEARLVLAPRHPENGQVIEQLKAALNDRGLSWRFRSEHGDAALPDNCQVLVLDTLGELRDFYGVASMAHVGRDHNILEPLAYACPVSVRPDWNPTYPSFPVYEMTHAGGLLVESDDPQTLAQAWYQLLTDRAQRSARSASIQRVLAQARGATQRTLDAVREVTA